MSYLLDTDFVSIFSKRRPSAAASRWLAAHEDDCRISVVTWAELRYGVSLAEASARPALSAWLKQTETAFRDATADLGLDVLIRWKELLADLKRQNRTIACEDSLIAATALHRGWEVVTCNPRHFAPTGVNVVAF